MFRGGTVITVDSAGVLEDADVLIVGDTIEAVGSQLEVPEGTLEIDASGGIVMPGMIDTHRHMWQTALRGYGGDWALSQYFVFYYLHAGQVFRPEDIYAGNLLSALESVDTGRHDDARLVARPAHARVRRGRAPGDSRDPGPLRARATATTSARRGSGRTARSSATSSVDNFNAPDDMLGLQIAFDVPDDRGLPEQGAPSRPPATLGLRVTTHAGVWGATTDNEHRPDV